MTKLEQVLEVAKKEIGTKEQPINSNKGPVEKYQLYVGKWLVGGPYCAAFVSWCFAQVFGNLTPIGKQASAVAGMWTRAKSRKDLKRYTPQDVLEGKENIKCGDIFVLTSDPATTKRIQEDKIQAHTGHTGLCDGITRDKNFCTIEGNTSPGGSRDGGGVYARTRRSLLDTNLVGFVRYIGE